MSFQVKNKKRWSQVMYMSYVLDFLTEGRLLPQPSLWADPLSLEIPRLTGREAVLTSLVLVFYLPDSFRFSFPKRLQSYSVKRVING